MEISLPGGLYAVGTTGGFQSAGRGRSGILPDVKQNFFSLSLRRPLSPHSQEVIYHAQE